MPNLSELLYYNGEISLQLIVWSLFLGVVVATIAGYLIKTKFGSFIRKLLENQIDSPDKAVTLEELGLQNKPFIKFSLKSHANYKNMLVAITEDGKFYANNTYTDSEPEFQEFSVIKRQRTRNIIKETKKESEDENVPLSSLAKVLQTKEKLSARNETYENSATTVESIAESVINKKTEETAQNNCSSDTSSNAASNAPKHPDIPKERVKFDITKARYYIPPEIHDRAQSLYYTKTGKANNLLVTIALLIVLALIATFFGKLVAGFTDFLSGINNPFSKNIL